MSNADETAAKRPDLCASMGHPGVTFNPWRRKTWCLCGSKTYRANKATHVACCEGPLTGGTAEAAQMDCAQPV